MQHTILAYGWYNQGNVGDELFKEAFRTLFPEYQFIFTDRITQASLKDVSAVFVGGGSFLYAPLNMEAGAFELLRQKKIFYIGVGTETEIHALHLELMSKAQLLAVRSNERLSFIQALNTNTMVIPDIVYSLQSSVVHNDCQDRSVLIMPNMAVVPGWHDPHWKHASWNYFKSEFAQFLDILIDYKYSIKFMAMCQNKLTDDNFAAIEIINHMKNRKSNYLLNNSFSGIESVTSTISQYSTIITQRFHGIVLSEMARIPYVSLYHHDKLKHCSPGEGVFLSYYGISKAQLLDGFERSQKKFSSLIPIETNIFGQLRASVIGLIDG
jgi:polysaccharide pyruvyl transferase WcaK-like protein